MRLLLKACQIDLDTRTVTRGDAQHRLTGTEANLLRYLNERPREVISREELYREVWGHKVELLTRTLDLAVFRLRKKIEEDPRNPDHVMTVYGRGYSFVPTGADTQTPQTEATPEGPVITTNLGREESHFFGREDEQRTLTQLMQTRSGFITVLGPPGTGKTRLTKHWAAKHLSSKAVSSAWFCDLTEARSEEGIIQAVATSLGISLTTKKSGMVALAELVGDAIQALGSTIIVIDNVEQVVTWVGPLVSNWWTRAPEASFILTSQVPTGVSMEQRMPLSALTVPDPEGSESPCAAVQLFVDRAQSVKPDFEQTTDNQAAIAAIVRELDGLPLAIELAAARMHLMSPAILQSRLADRFRILKRPKQAGPARHQTLHAALDWSWGLLAPWEQAALAQCSVFHGGFDWEAVEAVIDLSDWPEAPWSVDVVAELVERSLVMVNEDQGGLSRLSMMASVSEYARHRLAESQSTCAQAAGHRHAQHYAQYGSRAHVDSLQSTGSISRLRQVRRELENLIVGVDVAMTHKDADTAAACAIAAGTVLTKHGPFRRAVEVLKRTSGCQPATFIESQRLYFLGWALKLSGHIDQARAAYEQSLDLARGCEDTHRQSIVLASLSTLIRDQGEADAGLQLLEDALDIANTHGHKRAQINVTARLGVLKADQGKTTEAVGYYQQAIELARELGNRTAEGISTGNIANLYLEEGEYILALEHYQEALKISREVGNQRGVAIGLGNLAKLHHAMGNHETSLEFFETALVAVRKTGEVRIEGLTLGNLGSLLYSQGKLDSAEEHFKLAISICDKVLPPAAAYYRSLLALLRSDQDASSEARALLEAAEQQLKGSRETEVGQLLCRRAQVECMAGDPKTAAEYLSRAERIAARLGTSPKSNLSQAIAQARSLLGRDV